MGFGMERNGKEGKGWIVNGSYVVDGSGRKVLLYIFNSRQLRVCIYLHGRLVESHLLTMICSLFKILERKRYLSYVLEIKSIPKKKKKGCICRPNYSISKLRVRSN